MHPARGWRATGYTEGPSSKLRRGSFPYEQGCVTLTPKLRGQARDTGEVSSGPASSSSSTATRDCAFPCFMHLGSVKAAV